MNNKWTSQTQVLIIDDQVLAKGYLKYTLEELGFANIHYISDTATAIDTLKATTFDLIICGYDLKEEKEGYYLYEQLKAQRILPLTTAFVFISADTSAEVVHSIVELQPDEFLAKPFTIGDLSRRLKRVISRKHVLKAIYQSMDNGEYEGALAQLEIFLTDPAHADFFPLALRTKGELLTLCKKWEEAADFYQAIINVQNFTWAQLGLVRCYIQLNRDAEAEKMVVRLAFQQDAALAAYDLLAALQIKQQEFDEALECITLASSLSPRNIQRHRQALDLSRITHNYEAQFLAAKRIVKYARNSIHDRPENYLNVARSGIDYAMTADPTETRSLVKQANDYLQQLKNQFPDANVDTSLAVISARLYYLEDESENARALMEKLKDDNWEADSIETLLDKAKAFHEVGLQEYALSILDEIEHRCVNSAEQGEVFLHYLHQEKTEKGTISRSPKALNNAAVFQYHQGDLDAALETFRQAFTVMPKNPSIALNLLQAMASDLQKHGRALTKGTTQQIHNCMETLETVTLSDDQRKRYNRAKALLLQHLTG